MSEVIIEILAALFLGFICTLFVGVFIVILMSLFNTVRLITRRKR